LSPEELDTGNGLVDSLDMGVGDGGNSRSDYEDIAPDSHPYDSDADLVAINMNLVNETVHLQKYKATSLMDCEDSESLISESTECGCGGEEKMLQPETVSKTGTKRKVGASNVVGGPAKRQHVTKSKHATSKTKGNVSLSSNTAKSKGPVKKNVKSNKHFPALSKRNVRKEGGALKKLARSRKVSNTAKGKGKLSTAKVAPPLKIGKARTNYAAHRKTVPAKAKSAKDIRVAKDKPSVKQKLKKPNNPVGSKKVTKTASRKIGTMPSLKSPKSAKSNTLPEFRAKPTKTLGCKGAGVQNKTPRKQANVKKSVGVKSPKKSKSSPKMQVNPKTPARPKTPVNSKVSKTPKTTKRILATNQRKVSRRPLSETPKKRAYGLKIATTKISVVTGRKATDHSGHSQLKSVRPKRPVLKRPRVVKATVTVQDLPIAGKGKPKQHGPRRKVSNSKLGNTK
jgi:hypothetical protein